jgi:hypothetical protein
MTAHSKGGGRAPIYPQRPVVSRDWLAFRSAIATALTYVTPDDSFSLATSGTSARMIVSHDGSRLRMHVIERGRLLAAREDPCELDIIVALCKFLNVEDPRSLRVVFHAHLPSIGLIRAFEKHSHPVKSYNKAQRPSGQLLHRRLSSTTRQHLALFRSD